MHLKLGDFYMAARIGPFAARVIGAARGQIGDAGHGAGDLVQRLSTLDPLGQRCERAIAGCHINIPELETHGSRRISCFRPLLAGAEA